MEGMTQDIAIPRMTGTSSSAYYTEGGTISESTPTFDQVTLSANTLAALVEFSRKMFVQGLPDVTIVRRDLARVLGLKIDETILNGRAHQSLRASLTPQVSATSRWGLMAVLRPTAN